MVRLKGFQKLTLVDNALKTWLEPLQVKKCGETTIPLGKALNRILAIDIFAEEHLPRFDKSAVDGYAVRAEETIGASQFKPIIFHLTREKEVNSKQAREIWTGSPLPKGANAVIMIENTKRNNEELQVMSQLAIGGNVAKRGEDVKKGEKILKVGTRLKAHHLALLAALGTSEIKVAEKPRIGILATGNELAEVGSKPLENQIFDSNRIMLSALCRELGAEPIDLGIAKDDPDEIAEKLRRGLKNCDAIITSGGTSVGERDLVPDVVNSLGKPGVIIHGIALRPAMPTALAVLGRKPLMILSGNPVAATVGFEAFARPLICKMLGMKKEEPRPMAKAIMTRKVASTLGRRTFVRVRVTRNIDQFFAEPISARGSGAISTMTRGNGFVIVPENREGVAEGETVTVSFFGTVESVK